MQIAKIEVRKSPKGDTKQLNKLKSIKVLSPRRKGDVLG